MPQTPKKLKRLLKSLTGRWERASKRQTTVTRLDEQYSQRDRQNNLIYNQKKRHTTSSPQPSTSRQPTEIELMLANLEITEYAKLLLTLTWIVFDTSTDQDHFVDT
jgi:protein involved in temperature-dependent protein secretion